MLEREHCFARSAGPARFKEKWDRDLKDMRDVQTTSGSRLSLVSMMARNTNVPLMGRIQKRKTSHLQILTFGLQRAAGPYR